MSLRRVVATAVFLALTVCSVALAKATPGYYVDSTEGVSISTTADGTAIKYIGISCDNGALLLRKHIAISRTGTFHFKGSGTIYGLPKPFTIDGHFTKKAASGVIDARGCPTTYKAPYRRKHE